MQQIDPYTFYDSDELRDILSDRIKIDTLRQHGLVGLGKGYFGMNVIDALNSWCKYKAQCQRGLQEMENNHEKAKLSKGEIQTRQIYLTPRNENKVESQRERLKRKVSKD